MNSNTATVCILTGQFQMAAEILKAIEQLSAPKTELKTQNIAVLILFQDSAIKHHLKVGINNHATLKDIKRKLFQDSVEALFSNSEQAYYSRPYSNYDITCFQSRHTDGGNDQINEFILADSYIFHPNSLFSQDGNYFLYVICTKKPPSRWHFWGQTIKDGAKRFGRAIKRKCCCASN